jgi:hypothetical protein
MSQPNLAAMAAVAGRLDGIGLEYAFLGGSIVNLLLDHPGLSPARPTDDVDVVIETVASYRYAELEAQLRRLGFDHDMRENAPRSRWILGGITVDIMPTDGAFLGLNTAWFKEALASAALRTVEGRQFRLISPVAFLATKYVAFLDRGRRDYYASHDLEDLITVIDGCEEIVQEVQDAPSELRAYVIGAIRELLAVPSFEESLAGHLPADRASQQRLPGLRRKLSAIAELT